MTQSLAAWIMWFLVLLLLGFSVPFLFLKDVPNLAGSFLFWTLWALAAIVSMFVAFARWTDTPDSISAEE